MSIKVVCRVRPPTTREANETREHKKIIAVDENHVTLWRPEKPLRFTFDHALDGAKTQRDVFELVRPLIREVVEGYEATVFAYGQTGTGKTHTMMGDIRLKNRRGLIPRAAEYLCEMSTHPMLQPTKLWVSFLEIYNEELSDLISPSGRLQLQDTTHGTVCRNLSQHLVRTADEVLEILLEAQEHQKVAETKMNKVSSRSHCIFTIKMQTEKKSMSGDVIRRTGKLHLVDLAGSECGKSAGGGAVQERERKNINQSLLTLGRVVGALKSGENQRVPYRDSKLTRLLKESLGGRCKTLLIATLSPSHHHIEETSSTLQYARNALHVVNAPMRNECFGRATSSLNAEIQSHLKEALASSHPVTNPQLDKAIATLVQRRCAILPDERDMQKQIDRMIEKSVIECFRSLESVEHSGVDLSLTADVRMPLTSFSHNISQRTTNLLDSAERYKSKRADAIHSQPLVQDEASKENCSNPAAVASQESCDAEEHVPTAPTAPKPPDMQFRRRHVNAPVCAISLCETDHPSGNSRQSPDRHAVPVKPRRVKLSIDIDSENSPSTYEIRRPATVPSVLPPIVRHSLAGPRSIDSLRPNRTRNASTGRHFTSATVNRLTPFQARRISLSVERSSGSTRASSAVARARGTSTSGFALERSSSRAPALARDLDRSKQGEHGCGLSCLSISTGVKQTTTSATESTASLSSRMPAESSTTSTPQQSKGAKPTVDSSGSCLAVETKMQGSPASEPKISNVFSLSDITKAADNEQIPTEVPE